MDAKLQIKLQTTSDFDYFFSKQAEISEKNHYFCTDKQKFSLMKKSLILIALVALLASCQESLEQQAERVLREQTRKNCPRQMAEDIIMDSCAYDKPTRTLHYYYTFEGRLDNDSLINAVHDNMYNNLLEAFRNETSMKDYRDAGFKFQYTYHSKSEPEKVLFDAVLSKDDM